MLKKITIFLIAMVQVFLIFGYSFAEKPLSNVGCICIWMVCAGAFHIVEKDMEMA